MQTLNIQEISLPVKLLLDHGMSPNSYTYLFYIYHNQIHNAYVVSSLQRKEVDDLVYDGYIVITKEYREVPYEDRKLQLNEPEVRLTEKGLALFEESDLDKKFDEFWELFPSSVPDGAGGVRILRAKTKESFEYKEVKRKYLGLIKKTGVHEKIIQGLKAQLHLNKHKMQFFQAINPWLNSRTYEKYQDIIFKPIIKVKGI